MSFLETELPQVLVHYFCLLSVCLSKFSLCTFLMDWVWSFSSQGKPGVKVLVIVLRLQERSCFRRYFTMIVNYSANWTIVIRLCLLRSINCSLDGKTFSRLYIHFLEEFFFSLFFIFPSSFRLLLNLTSSFFISPYSYPFHLFCVSYKKWSPSLYGTDSQRI